MVVVYSVTALWSVTVFLLNPKHRERSPVRVSYSSQNVGRVVRTRKTTFWPGSLPQGFPSEFLRDIQIGTVESVSITEKVWMMISWQNTKVSGMVGCHVVCVGSKSGIRVCRDVRSVLDYPGLCPHDIPRNVSRTFQDSGYSRID